MLLFEVLKIVHFGRTQISSFILLKNTLSSEQSGIANEQEKDFEPNLNINTKPTRVSKIFYHLLEDFAFPCVENSTV
jgi:hypothetical protein